MLSTIQKKSSQTAFIFLVFFLFPIGVATLPHVGSNLYILLSLASLVHFKVGWAFLVSNERRVLKAFILFFFLSCFSLILTDDLREGVKRIERYLRLLFIVPIYLMLRRKGIDSAKPFMSGLFCALVVMGGQAAYEVLLLKAAQASGAYHKIVFGDLAILFSALIFISAFFFERSRFKLFLLFCSLSFGIYASVESGTRTAWMFVPVLSVALVAIFRKEAFFNRKKIALVAILSTSLLALALQSGRIQSGLMNGVNDLRGFKVEREGEVVSSWGLRLVMWRNSFLIFKESPLVGTGMGDFRHDSLVLDQKGLSYKSEFAVNQANAHSLYFQLLAEGGLLGIGVLLLSVFIFPFLALIEVWKNFVKREVRFYALGGLVTLIGFAWFGVSESWVNRNPLITTYSLMLVVFMTSAFNLAYPVSEKKS